MGLKGVSEQYSYRKSRFGFLGKAHACLKGIVVVLLADETIQVGRLGKSHT